MYIAGSLVPRPFLRTREEFEIRGQRYIPVAVLDLPDLFPGLSPPPNFKFLARAQKGSGNETIL